MKILKPFKIKIGKVVSEVFVRGSLVSDEIPQLFSGFATDEKPDVKVYAECVENLRYNDYEGPAPAQLIKPNIYNIKWYYFSGEFDTKMGVVKVSMNNKPFILSSLLRIVYAIKMIKENGLFVHASSFVRDGVAYIFPGKSGAGKTTLAKMAVKADEGIQLLSDEISLISFERGKAFAYSTPFWGGTKIMGRYIKAPLKGIYFINQSKKTYKRRIEEKKALQNLLTNILFASLDQDSLSAGLKTAKNIINKTDCSILNFQKNASFLEVI